jgi:hypothetical protein
MAQQIIYENTMQSTVDFSTVANGDIFIYGESPCVKLDKNNPNYVVIDTGVNGKLEDTDQVLLPNKVIVKVE